MFIKLNFTPDCMQRELTDRLEGHLTGIGEIIKSAGNRGGWKLEEADGSPRFGCQGPSHRTYDFWCCPWLVGIDRATPVWPAIREFIPTAGVCGGPTQ